MIKLKDILKEAFQKNHFLNLIKQEIDSLKGQIAYSNDKVNYKGTEDWEKKEFKAVLKDLKKKLKDTEQHYKRVQKLKEEKLTEASFTKKRDFGNQKYWTVTKSFTAKTYTGKYKGTGQHYGGHGRGTQELQKAVMTKLDVKKGMELQALPGGLFIIDDRKKKAYSIQDKSFSINDKFVEPRDSKITDFSLWKRWSPYKDTR